MTTEKYDSDAVLIDTSGKVYDLSPPDKNFRSDFANSFADIRPGQSAEWILPVALKDYMKPGDYKLKVSREITFGNPVGKEWKLVSNTLSISVK